MNIYEISAYLGITGLICTECGSVNAIKDITVEEWLPENGNYKKKKWRGHCPECNTYIKDMPTMAVKKVFWPKQKEMIELAGQTNSLLMWMLKNEFGTDDNRLYIEQIIIARANTKAPIPDFFMTRTEAVLREKVAKTRRTRLLRIEAIEILLTKAGNEALTCDGFTIGIIQKKVNKWSKELQKLREEEPEEDPAQLKLYDKP
jgi:hypothetical protein